MGLNLDKEITAGDLTIQHRIKRYDVQWGRPPYALTYKRLMFSLNPLIHWGMNDDGLGTTGHGSDNLGVQGHGYVLQFTGSGLTWVPGDADPTDNSTDFNNAGYGQCAVAIAPTDLNRGYTMQAWVFPTSAVNGPCGVLGTQYSYGVYGGLSLTCYGANGSYFVQAIFNGLNLTSTTLIPVGEWSLITVTVEPTGPTADSTQNVSVNNPRSWTGSICRLYINGQLDQEDDTFGSAPQQSTTPAVKMVVGAVMSGGSAWNQTYFPGMIDEVTVLPMPISGKTIEQAYVVGAGLSYIEPDEQFDNDAITEVSTQLLYGDLIKGDKPIHYWNLNALDGNNFDDNGTYNAGLLAPVVAHGDAFKEPSAVDNNDLGPLSLDNGPNKWRRLAADGNNLTAVGLPWHLPQGSYSDVSLEIWYKNCTSSHSDEDGVVGYAYSPSFGCCIVQQGGTVRGYINNDRGGAKLEIPNFPENIWVHLVLVANIATQQAILYMNGSAMSTVTCAGMRIPDGSEFRIGGGPGGHHRYSDHGNLRVDEIAIYPTALTSTQVSAHYYTGTSGPFRRRTQGGDSVDTGGPFILNANEYSILINEEDITPNIETYLMDTDIKQVVNTGSMTARADWGVTNIYTKLCANTYIVIERRFISPILNTDSGWQPFGHFLVEGPVGSQVTAAGDKLYNVSIKSVAKMLSFDLAHIPIQGDKLFQPKVVMDSQTGDPEEVQLQLTHKVVQGAFYQNWAESPAVKIWATNFQNPGDANDQKYGGISSPTDVIRVKGTEGAVQILGGKGAIVIARAFFEDKVNNDGLGDPSTIMAEFWRYADTTDVELVTLTSFAFDNQYSLYFARGDQIADGKGVFIKSGKAKGKRFKVRQSAGIGGKYLPLVATPNRAYNSSLQGGVARTGSHGSWNSRQVSDVDDVPFYTLRCSITSDESEGGAYTPYLRFKYSATSLSNNTIDDDAILTGVQVLMGYQFSQDGNFSGQFSQDSILFTLDGTTSGAKCTRNLSDGLTRGTDSAMNYNIALGDGSDTLGLAPITYGQLQTYFNTMSVMASFGMHSQSEFDFGTGYVDVAQMQVQFTFASLQKLVLTDINNFPINPEWEGLAVGDTVQIGDYNAPDDAMRKILLRNGYQENDPTLPFYFTLEQAPAELAPICPPLRPTIQEQQTWLDIMGNALNSAPPNYALRSDSVGVMTGAMLGFVPGALPNHAFVGVVDHSQDASDYGIMTRTVGVGDVGEAINVALGVAGGGTATSRAYNLDHYADDYKSATGISLKQSDADIIIAALFDGSPKTPFPGFPNRTPPNWVNNTGNSTSQGYTIYYGVICHERAGMDLIKRWTFEDMDLCAVDIGRSSSGTPIEVAKVQVTSFNWFPEGNPIQQSVYVYYMTEDDYRAEFGVAVPDEPNVADNSYFPPAQAASWKLLIDEFATPEGTTEINSNDFDGGQPVKFRFMKFVIGQAWYRPPVINSVFGEKNSAVARVVLADIKVYNSTDIYATAELGVTDPFASVDYRQLAQRVRRRTEFIEKNVTLNTYAAVKAAMAAELQERLIDYTPIVVTGFAPTVEAGEIVEFTNAETLVTLPYLVVAAQQDQTGVGKFQILNYEAVLS